MSKALVIIGGQGSGKTTKAIAAAKAVGSYVFLNYHSLKSRFELGSALEKSPACVIVEEAPLRLLEDPIIKGLVSNDKIVIERKGQDPMDVDAPEKWIFTVQLDSRRFDVECV